MKLFKLMIIGLLGILMFACSQDDDINPDQIVVNQCDTTHIHTVDTVYIDTTTTSDTTIIIDPDTNTCEAPLDILYGPWHGTTLTQCTDGNCIDLNVDSVLFYIEEKRVTRIGYIKGEIVAETMEQRKVIEYTCSEIVCEGEVRTEYLLVGEQLFITEYRPDSTTLKLLVTK